MPRRSTATPKITETSKNVPSASANIACIVPTPGASAGIPKAPPAALPMIALSNPAATVAPANWESTYTKKSLIEIRPVTNIPKETAGLK